MRTLLAATLFLCTAANASQWIHINSDETHAFWIDKNSIVHQHPYVGFLISGCEAGKDCVLIRSVYNCETDESTDQVIEKGGRKLSERARSAAVTRKINPDTIAWKMMIEVCILRRP